MTSATDDDSSASARLLSASDAVAARLREVRKGRGWTANELAERCSRAGLPISKSVLANIESGRPGDDGRRRRDITVDELLALALVLDVAPIYLMAPTQDQAKPTAIAVTPEVSIEDPDQLLLWLRGDQPLPATDSRRYFTAALEHMPMLDSARVMNELRSAVLQDRTSELLDQFRASKELIAAQAQAELNDVTARVAAAVDAGADSQEVLRILQAAGARFKADGQAAES
jgi:transcriptional regulator with XRE-family HTH domain